MLEIEDVIKWLTEISLRPCDFATDDFDSYTTEHLANEALEICEDAKVFCKQRNDAFELLKEKLPKQPTWRRGKAFCGWCGGCLENKEQHSSDIVSSIRFCKWCGVPVDWSNE